ncbi:MAG: ABC transporter permease [Clostridiales bacterium]|jgi:ABC-type transport system involved in multi-copper enzyme maturation permease subunit|nr:ABC transporter permease [Clostridiales bacterium]
MKKFFERIGKLMLRLKLRFFKPSKNFGKRRLSDMGRLLRGEFFKFFKGAIFKVSVAVLLLSTVLTVFLYGSDSNIMEQARSLMSGGLEMDVFTIMDGINPELLSVASEFGVDIPAEAMTMLDTYFGDAEKTKFLLNSPKQYYASINPARKIEDRLSEQYSEKLTEYIIEDKNFIRLIINDEVLMKAIQDYSSGSGANNALVTDVNAFIEDNGALIALIGSLTAAAAVVAESPLLESLDQTFYKLKDPDETEPYEFTAFVLEFAAAMGAELIAAAENAGGLSSFDIIGIARRSYEQTKLYSVHGVSGEEFFVAATPDVNEWVILAGDIYATGLFDAIAGLSGGVAIGDLVAGVISATLAPRELTEAERAELLPPEDEYSQMTDAERAAVYAEALSTVKYRDVRDYIFEYLRENYPAFYEYVSTMPLFNLDRLKRLVSDEELVAEIYAKQALILATYLDICAGFYDESGDLDKTLEDIIDFLVYFVGLGELHSTLYSTFANNLVGLASEILRAKSILDFFYNDGQYGRGAYDFFVERSLLLGGEFEALFELANNQGGLTEAEYLKLLTESVNTTMLRFAEINVYARSGVSYIYFKAENSYTEPPAYEAFRRQYDSYSRMYRSLMVTVNNPSAFNSVKILSIKSFVKNLTSAEGGFFSDIDNAGLSSEQKMAVMLDVFKAENCYSAVVDKAFFEEKFAFLYDEINDAMKAYLTVYKDSFESVDALLRASFDAEQYDELMVYYYNDDAEGFSYAELRDVSRRFTRIATLVNDYVPKVYLDNVVIANGLNDEQLGKIYGFTSLMGLGTTKYSIRSDATKDLFFFENLDLYDKLTDPMSLDNGYGFVNFGLAFMYMFVMMIAIVIASATIASEYETGSIKLLLIRPYRRYKVLTAKFLFVAITLAVMFIFMYLILLLFGQTGSPFWTEGLNGLNSRDVLVVFDARQVLIMSPLDIVTLEFVFYYINCLIYAVIAVMISTIFKSRAASVAVSVFVFFASQILSALLSSYSWYKFIIFNNTNFFVYMSTGPSLADMTLMFSVVVYAIYMVVFFALSYVVFEKRDAV